MTVGYIYILKFLNGKRYVGQTTGTVDTRLKRHWYDAVSGCSYLIHNAMRKYGANGVDVEHSCPIYGGQQALDAAEDSYIVQYNTMAPHGYNLRRGGRGGRPGKVVRAKLSAARRGKTHSDETKAKISTTNRGRVLSEEHKSKISAANKGKSKPLRTEEHKNKISKANKGKSKPPRSKEHRVKIAAALKGYPGYWEGQSRSDETRAKMSASQKERWAKIKKEKING
jgi:group I intron endonuclease